MIKDGDHKLYLSSQTTVPKLFSNTYWQILTYPNHTNINPNNIYPEQLLWKSAILILILLHNYSFSKDLSTSWFSSHYIHSGLFWRRIYFSLQLNPSSAGLYIYFLELFITILLLAYMHYIYQMMFNMEICGPNNYKDSDCFIQEANNVMATIVITDIPWIFLHSL